MSSHFRRSCRRRDRRSEVRKLCSELVEILWEGGRAVAILENISSSGGGLVCPLPVPEGVLLRLVLSTGARQATVRYCRTLNGVYLVGLSFPRELGNQPIAEHLLCLTAE